MEQKNIRSKVILLAILSAVLIILIIIAIALHLINPGTDSESAKSLSSNNIISKQIHEIEINHLDENGIVAPEDVTALMDDIYNGIKDSNHIKHIEKHDTSVYYILDNNIGCHYIAPIPGLASSGSDLVIYSYQPWYSNFERENTTPYVEWVQDFLYKDGVEYPNKAINTLEESDLTENNAHYLYDEDVTIEKLKNLRGNSVILWVGHGGYSSENHSTLVLTTELNESFYKDHYDDFDSHRLEEAKVYGEKYVAVTSLFFDKYLTDGCLENTIIYLATCHSTEDDVLATALLNKGAAAVYGNSDEVWQAYNNRMCKSVIENLSKGDTVDVALQKAKDTNGDTDTYAYFFTRDAHVRYYGENNLTLSTLHSRINNNSLQGQTPNSDSETVQNPGNIETIPTQQELFNERCWMMALGPTLGTQYVVKTCSDGTYTGYNIGNGTKIDGTYTYENGVLYLYGVIWNLTDGSSFQSAESYYSSQYDADIHYELLPGGEDIWAQQSTEDHSEKSDLNGIVGVWKCRIQSDGETFLNEIGFAENGEVYIYDSIENGETFATIYGEWELIEQEGDLYYVELFLPGIDEDGSTIQFRTRIIIEKQGQQAYIRHLSGQQTDIYYDCLFARE